jgi:hypothetical protein
MKEHLTYLSILIGSISSLSCTAQGEKTVQSQLIDTLNKVVNINIAGNAFIKELNYLDVFDVYMDTLFLVNNENRLLEIDLKKGGISLAPVNDVVLQTKVDRLLDSD